MSQTTVSAGKVYRRSEDFAVRTIAGDTILMPVRSSGAGPDSIFILNETGSAIWRILATPAPLEAVVDALAAEFEVGKDQAEADALAFVELLSKAQLIREA